MCRQDPIAELMSLLRDLTDDAEFYQELGKLFRKRFVMDAAKACFETSLALDPCDPFTHLFLGNWYYTQEDYPAALECCRYAAELMPDNAVVYWTQANIYEKQGKDDLAEEFYQRAVEVGPDDRTARRKLRQWRKRRSGEA